MNLHKRFDSLFVLVDGMKASLRFMSSSQLLEMKIYLGLKRCYPHSHHLTSCYAMKLCSAQLQEWIHRTLFHQMLKQVILCQSIS